MSDRLRVIIFPGVQDLPNFAAESQGFFTRRGLEVETVFTSGSKELRAGLADGTYDLAHGAVDNAIDMILRGGHDIVAFCGLDHGFNKFFVQPDIASYDDLRGRTIVVDAPDTAFALMIYEILERQGLRVGDYKVSSVGSTRFRLDAMKAGPDAAAAMLNLPFAILAERAGLRVMADPAEALGRYQSCCGFARRDWMAANPDVLTRYIAAYVEGLHWALAPANRGAAIQLLVERLKIDADVAGICYDIVVNPVSGFEPNADIDREGFSNMLALRAKTGNGPDDLSPDPFIDLSCHKAALALL
jgi:ABC-type nitrate/sulfonate/bicarbonate transport system substrate-binding protein